jgi:hypothetical protein
MSTTSELTRRILDADRDTVYEAAQLYAATLDPDAGAVEPDHPVLQAPLEHLEDIEDLARVVLLVAATSDPEEVSVALDGAGRRQLVLGGVELVALATLGLGALQILVTKGRTREVTTETVREGAGGDREVVKTTETTYGISSQLASLLRGVIGSGG